MSNVLFVSKYGDSLPLAQLALREGHRVAFFCEKRGDQGEGLVKRVTSWRKFVRDADLIIFDMVGFGAKADLLKKLNPTIFGASKVADKLELDRSLGLGFMKSNGIKVPRSKKFGDKRNGLSYLKSEKGRYVLKPIGNKATSWTYVAMDDESKDLEEILKSSPNGPFELQEFVEGIEISTEGWFDGKKFVLPFNHTYEEKKFMNGNLGPAIGCAGNVVEVAKEDDWIVEKTLKKIETPLSKLNYIGPIDINCIVKPEEKEAYGLEWTMRLGYDAIWALCELFQTPVIDFLRKFTIGRELEMPLDENSSAIAVRLSIPPYPYKSGDLPSKGIPVMFDKEALPHLWLSDVYKNNKGYFSAGVDGVICAVSAKGRDVRECKRRVYRTISNMTIPNVQYRTDIGDRVERDKEKIGVE